MKLVDVMLQTTPPACQSATAITIQPQPIKLEIETPIDWGTIFIGLASAAVALAVGYMGYVSQRNQVRALTANFRHNWQQEIKQMLSKLVSITIQFHHKIESDPNYREKPESNNLFSELTETYARIELMLDRKKPYSTEITKTIGILFKSIEDHDTQKLSEVSTTLIDLGNSLVEQTWQDIRKDLKEK